MLWWGLLGCCVYVLYLDCNCDCRWDLWWMGIVVDLGLDVCDDVCW